MLKWPSVRPCPPFAQAQTAIIVAWRWFVNAVELAVAQATDTVLRNPGRRGQVPQPVWRNVLPKPAADDDKIPEPTSEPSVRKRLRGKQPPSASPSPRLVAQTRPCRVGRSSNASKQANARKQASKQGCPLPIFCISKRRRGPTPLPPPSLSAGKDTETATKPQSEEAPPNAIQQRKLMVGNGRGNRCWNLLGC